jgi:DNA polymerase II large subunit
LLFAENKLTTPLPEIISQYYSGILRDCEEARKLASFARRRGLDPSMQYESKFVLDLADRVGELLGLSQFEGLVDRLRDLLQEQGKERAAITISQEIALGKFGQLDTEKALEYGVRAGLAIMTDGVTVAPIQGLYSVSIKKNDDGSNYPSLCFAGPMRSAGGTEAGFTVVIADIVARKLGLSRFIPKEEEIGRFVEELRIYERDVGNFQFHVTDDDVRFALSNIPVEIDGVETDPVEVIVHRNLKRIGTNRVRGGALRVLNDGIIGRANKLVKKLADLGVTGWEWLTEIKGGKQRSNVETEQTQTHFEEVISGRAVLSLPKRVGGFRLRYGRSMNTGLSTVGIHPAVTILLDYPVVVGTQIKIDIPGKAATVAFVDSIEPPTLLLKDRSVVKARTLEMARKLKEDVLKILDMGDILISYGDFLENNKELPPSPYVLEWWQEELKFSINDVTRKQAILSFIDDKRLNDIIKDPRAGGINAQEAVNLSKTLGIPLCPLYTPRIENLSISEITELREKLEISDNNVRVNLDTGTEYILHKLLVEYTVHDGKAWFTNGWDIIIKELFNKNALINGTQANDSVELVERISSIKLGRQTSRTIGVRVGRPEKAMLRKLKPPVHCLFPVGGSTGQKRDLIEASKRGTVCIEMVNNVCPLCKERRFSVICERCSNTTVRFLSCPKCKIEVQNSICPKCKGQATNYSEIEVDLSKLIGQAMRRVKVNSVRSLKGVKGLTSQSKFPERIEKGILRSKYGLYVYKDGTIRIDITNAPLTHFRPLDIDTTIEKLRALGYTHDINGQELNESNQVLELKPQDVVLPLSISDDLVRIANFVDQELSELYDLHPYYHVVSKEDLVGKLVIGLAPHTSAGIVGRIIGFSKSQVCFASPCWHAAKRRDCDGDGDSIMLLMDVLLNYSTEYVPDQIGGLMDVPLLIQPVVLPAEVDEQAHNFDVASRYPREFYELTQKAVPASTLENMIDTVKSRLGKEKQFYGFGFTHDTSSIVIDRERSAYSSLRTLKEKISKQIEIAEKIEAVSPKEVVESIIKTHLIRDIMGNAKKYASQAFKCKKCGQIHRRVPLSNRCIRCEGELRETLSQASVSKYLSIAKDLAERYGIDPYLNERIKSLEFELTQLFRKENTQLELSYFT